MLSEEEKREIMEECTRYEKKSAVCIEALRIVQRRHGWVSDDSIISIAQFLQMSPADVDGVATFYNLIFRMPVGKNVIFVCDSVSCWLLGCDQIKNYLRSTLGIEMGQTTPDGLFTALPIACLGHCESAPALWVNGDPILRTDETMMNDLIQKCREKAGGRLSA